MTAPMCQCLATDVSVAVDINHVVRHFCQPCWDREMEIRDVIQKAVWEPLVKYFGKSVIES